MEQPSETAPLGLQVGTDGCARYCALEFEEKLPEADFREEAANRGGTALFHALCPTGQGVFFCQKRRKSAVV